MREKDADQRKDQMRRRDVAEGSVNDVMWGQGHQTRERFRQCSLGEKEARKPSVFAQRGRFCERTRERGMICTTIILINRDLTGKSQSSMTLEGVVAVGL